MRISWLAGFIATVLSAQDHLGVSLRVTQEVAPAGSVVQLKFELTEPKPIARTKVGLSFDESYFEDVLGISLAEGAVGAASISHGRLVLEATASSASFGLSDDYPLATFAIKLKPGLAAGTRIPVSIDLGQSFFLNFTGQPYPEESKDGAVTIGGTLAIENVVPGGGLMTPGDQFRIIGRGFPASLAVRLAEEPEASVLRIAPNEILMRMRNTAEFEGTRVTVDNKMGEKAIYYSYLRARRSPGGADPLDGTLRPVFASRRSVDALLVRDRSSPAKPYLAVRNPQRTAVVISVQAFNATGNIGPVAQIPLGAAEFAVRSLQELLPADVLNASSWVRVTSPLGINTHHVMVNPDGTLAAVPPVVLR